MNAIEQQLKWKLLATVVQHGVGAVAAAATRVGRGKAGCPDARRGQILTPCAQKALQGLVGRTN